jgi:hypothetical protein
MDWSTLLPAAVGGLIGSGIPALMVFLGWRRQRTQSLLDRQWQDAEVVADVRQLLQDIDPMRRGASVNTAPGAEDALWKSFNERRDQVCKRLLVLAAAHPSAAVQSSAGKLEADLSRAVVHCEWHIHDLLLRRDNPEQLKFAQECHETAVATSADLDRAVKAAAQGKERGARFLPGVPALRRSRPIEITKAPRQP